MDAARLVVQAAALAKGGELFVVDCGDVFSLTELAERLIRLHRLRPGVDVEINYDDPPRGERSHEQLVGVNEVLYPTLHANIGQLRETADSPSLPTYQAIREFVATIPDSEPEALVSWAWSLVGARNGRKPVGPREAATYSHK